MSKKCAICHLNYRDKGIAHCRICGTKLDVEGTEERWEFIFRSEICGMAGMAENLLSSHGIRTALAAGEGCLEDACFPDLMVAADDGKKAADLLRINGFI